VQQMHFRRHKKAGRSHKGPLGPQLPIFLSFGSGALHAFRAGPKWRGRATSRRRWTSPPEADSSNIAALYDAGSATSLVRVQTYRPTRRHNSLFEGCMEIFCFKWLGRYLGLC